ncbi:PalH-domain-containing protein [Mollisia scopiformis]|uniref:PalH-domain-containing protein n=1 Tax=Mollisia scopiformis TaxID=149040 RepID=A0A194XNX8_MOLSC|nr:PalH-domain-containing protein [Mollisia scopiformis]KUJ21945.1 PalH-domain-containing protein [Mollisia scopiformis]
MDLHARQIINIARPTSTTSSTRAHCTPFTLPSNGVLTLGVSDVLTLTSDAVFKPECTGSNDAVLTGTDSPSYLEDFRDPFYASTIPECYALAAATVISYMLVIMLLITPRTFLHEGAVVLGRRGFTNGPSGSDAGIGIGGRPWLQKVAALTVAISLTIATADTFKVAEQQYETGYMDAQALQNQVEDGTELKVIRVISDTFLWLAQAQTLIRLFPRQREKIIIKWTAFALISLDVLFSLLNNFVYDGNSRPRSFVDAVPALAYLFQLALSLLYAAWVIYYSITKRRFAFYHPQMRNICLVALLSLVAILVPVVFFVLDISKPNLAGWGDYVRWVGAAAASVVVWEWVERIEALERNDKKDGVLGREVFDGDEMLDVDPSPDGTWKYRLKQYKDVRKGKGVDRGGDSLTTGSHGRHWPAMSGLANRYRPRATHDVENGREDEDQASKPHASRKPRPKPPLWPTRPPPAATPVSRTDTASAESTVYAIRYHPISDATPPPRNSIPPQPSRSNSLEILTARSEHEDTNEQPEKSLSVQETEEAPVPVADHSNPWQTLVRVNPFRRKAQDPPPEVSAHTVKPQEPVNPHGPVNKWDVRARFEDFAATQAEKLREKKRPTVNIGSLPVTVIPAPPRRRDLLATLDELEHTGNGERPFTSSSNTWVATPSTMADRMADRPSDPEAVDQSRSPQPQRMSDPYTPNDLNGHSIHQRGAISFATPGSQDRNGAVSPVSPISIMDRATPTVISSRGTPSQPHSPVSPRRDGLPFMSIPAPPRRPRSNEE